MGMWWAALALVVLACAVVATPLEDAVSLGASSDATGANSTPKWDTINYNCRCGASPVSLGPAATIAKCQAKVAGAKKTHGFYEAATRECFSAKSCDRCWMVDDQLKLIVFGMKKPAMKEYTCTNSPKAAGVVKERKKAEKGKLLTKDCGNPPCKMVEAKKVKITALAVTRDGKKAYVGDSLNSAVWVVEDPLKSSNPNAWTELAKGGWGDRNKEPLGAEDIVLSVDEKTLFLLDRVGKGATIKKMDIATKKITSFKHKFKASCCFDKPPWGEDASPSALAVTPDGKSVVVTDRALGEVRVIPIDKAATSEGKVLTTLRKLRPTKEHYSGAQGVAVSPDGRTVYVQDYTGAQIWAIQMETGAKKVLAGKFGKFGAWEPNDKMVGAGKDVIIGQSPTLAVTPDGKALFFSDTTNHAIRKMDLGTNAVTTLHKWAKPCDQKNCAGTMRLSSDGKLIFLGDGSSFSASATPAIRTISTGYSCKAKD